MNDDKAGTMPVDKEPVEELLKAVRDKLSELEDLQLVNKLDIINMKNELDRLSLTTSSSEEDVERIAELKKLSEKAGDLKKFENAYSELEKLKSELEKINLTDIGSLKPEIESIRKKISGLESGTAPAGMESEDTENIKKEIGNLRSAFESFKGQAGQTTGLQEQIDELRKGLSEVPASRQKGVKPGELQELLKRIENLESAKPVVKGGISPKVKAQIEELTEKVSGLESMRGKPKGKGVPDARLEKIREGLQAEIASIKKVVDEQQEKFSSLEKPKVEPDTGVFDKRISVLEKKMESEPEGDGRDTEKIESEIDTLKSLAEEQGKDILELRSSQKKRPDIDEEKIMKMKKALMETKAQATKDEIEDLRKEIQILRTSMSVGDHQKQKPDAGVSNDIEEIKKHIVRLDPISNEIITLKSKMKDIDGKLTQISVSPELLTEMKKMKEDFPAEEFTDIRSRMEILDKKLEKAGRLALGIKPVQLPGSGTGESKDMEDLGRRLESLESIVKKGASPEKLRELEGLVESLKSEIPIKISKDTDQRIADLKAQIDKKVHEMEFEKKEILESALEQLLAQPGSMNKFMDEKINKEVKELSEKVEKFGGKLSPSDAKVTALMKDSEDKERELEKIKSDLQEKDAKNRKNIESLEIELSALGAKLGTTHTAVKGMEGSGVRGAAMDMEIIKTKLDWLESTVHKFDLKDIYERLQDLEDRLTTGGHSPVIIE